MPKPRGKSKSVSVTISQLAERTGLSPITVSRALRGVGRMGDDTRKRIVHEATKMGYRPNSSARAMRTGRFGCVGALLSTRESASVMPAPLLRGIDDALAERNVHLTLSHLPDDKLLDAGYIPKILTDWMVDGLLVNYTHYIPRQMIDLIEENEIPSIWLNTKQDGNCVYPDDHAAALDVTRHLLELGHRRIAYADYYNFGTEESHYSNSDRYAGYAAAMQAAGLAPRRLGDVQHADRVPYTRQWLSAVDRPTAVVAYSPMMTGHAILYAAATVGLNVPADLSLVTFNDVATYEFDVKVATALLPEAQLGREAVAMLFEKIELPRKRLRPRVIPFTFDPGHSCGPCPAVIRRGQTRAFDVAGPAEA
jgi:LacI family transcriptional regulator